MPVTKEQHQKDIKRFIEERTHYQTFAKTMEQILNIAVNIYAPLSIVQVRAKNVSSFAEKIIRKNKYKDPLRDITDLCGARVITQTQEQIILICDFIRQNFLIDEANSLDVSERLNIKEFGYRSVHFIVTPVKDEILGIKIPEVLKDKKAEIQVRTLLQHTWSDVLHDRLYKTTLKIPKVWERESARLAALLENADENISRITSLTDSYTANYGNRMSEFQMKSEIDTLQTILDNEPNQESKPALALKIARLTKFAGKRQSIIDILTPYVDFQSSVQNEIKSELGFALCKVFINQPSSKQFLRGENYLLAVSENRDFSLEEQHLSPKSNNDNHASYLTALLYLAEIYENTRQFEKARNLFNTAYKIDFDNPYLYAKLLEHNNIFCEHKLLIQGNILKAIDACREHIYLGIESLKAYFTIARFNFLLGDYSTALISYAKAIDLMVSEEVCFCKELLTDEIQSLSRLQCTKKQNPEIECVVSVLHIANHLLFKDVSSFEYLNSFSTAPPSIKQPITIVSGGADNISPDSANKYATYLNYALIRYSGTIISGGTKSGVPGLLGKAVELSRKHGNDNINLIGYVPDNNVNGVNIDNTYNIVTTNGKTFTAYEPVRMWIDIIVSGINPKIVNLLGIEGGAIASIEYRLALSFGAKLGIIKDSGRAANELLKDSDWCNHKNLLPLPNESESVWAFINFNRPASLFSDLQLQDMAKVIHNNYVQDQIANLHIKDNLKPWSELNDDFKNSNTNQALFMSEILALNGFAIRDIVNDGNAIDHFKPEELNEMAKLEHGRWVAERLLAGWKFGPQKDTDKKISPFLVAWDEIPPDVQQYDVNNIVNYPNLLKMIGLEIYRIESK